MRLSPSNSRTPMARRRSVRPDSFVYRQLRRGRGKGGSKIILLIEIILAMLILWGLYVLIRWAIQ